MIPSLLVKFPASRGQLLVNSINKTCRTRSLSNSACLNAVELHYERVKASGSSPGKPLLICHGLFGSKQNWRSLSKILASRLDSDVYALASSLLLKAMDDLRNHGTSPHVGAMDYATMASDVLYFCDKHNLSSISLLGHSMGGKVAMAFALSPQLPPGMLSRLIVADITPSKGALSQDFRNYTDVMMKIEASNIHSRKEANEMLQEVEPDFSVRAFLLTNLTFPEDGAPVKFRVPVDIVKRSLDDLGGFPYEPSERKWPGKTLIIKGEKSRYVNKHNIAIAQQFFPSMRLSSLNAGHWGEPSLSMSLYRSP
ncbi:Alpha/Beta hydrolase protein [Hysterangium stoloniferum]|nr:Alpha/Beta hydrolase protein [Hysterangium stoloniferum]